MASLRLRFSCELLRIDHLVPSKQAVAAKGGDFLEAPVSGSKQPAEMATLIILAAGSKVHTNSTNPHYKFPDIGFRGVSDHI